MRRAVPRFPLFLALSGVLIAAVVIGSGLAVGRFFEDHVLGEDTTRTVEIVQSQARQHLTPESFLGTSSTPAAFEEFASGLPRVFRVKAFDRSARIVWSNEPRLIGLVFRDNRPLANALEGRVTVLLEDPKRTEHVYEQGYGWVAEAYVPMAFAPDGPLAGVIETYTDVTDIMTGIRATQRRVWLIGSLAGLLLYAALAVVVGRGARRERDLIRRLEHRNEQLAALQRFSQAVLGPPGLTDVADRVVAGAAEGLALTHAALYRVGDAAERTAISTWPRGSTATPPPDVLADAVAARRSVVRDSIVAVPLASQTGIVHVFVGDTGRGPIDREPGALGTLEVMLAQAATALETVDIVAEIRDAHERLEAILSGITDDVVIVDPDMRVLWANAAATADHLVVGRYCHDAFGVSREECAQCPGARCFVTGRVERGVCTQAGSGRTRYLDLVAAPLRDAGGGVGQVLEVARDITEFVEMETRVQETNAILDPLTGVLGALQALRDPSLTREEQTRVLGEAEADLHEISALIRRLGDVRRADSTRYIAGTRVLRFGGDDVLPTPAAD
jgi:PAS domain-containing protein